MKLGAKAAPAPAEPPTDSAPAEEPTDDLDFSTDDAGTEDQADTSSEPPADDTATDDSGASDKPFDDEPFDAGVEADEESDPKKFIEQLTGKLGQSLRKYNEDQGQPDFDLEKFAVNSLLSATHTGEMDAEDQKDIIKKVKSSGKGDGDEESTDDTETDDTDTETTDTETTDTETTDDGETTDTETTDTETDDSENMFETEMLDEMSLDDWKSKMLIKIYDDNLEKGNTKILHILTRLVSFSDKINREEFLQNIQAEISDNEEMYYILDKLKDLGVDVDSYEEEVNYNKMFENAMILQNPKKNNMFQPGSNDVLDEYEIYEVVEEGKKKKKKTKKDACYHKVRARYDVWPSAYACVPENTSKALTRDGWKDVNQLSIGEEIMTYNIKKDELEFKPILNLHRYKDVKTNVVRSGNNGFIFEATDNHKWVVKLPDIKGNRLQKYNRINDKALIETSDLLINKSNKSLVVSAPYNGGNNVKLDEIFKYGTNWVKYILDITSEQRQAWLFSAIVYDGNQQKVERLTENINNIDDLNWLYTGPHGKQSFGFKQKDIEHRDAFLLSAFLNSGLVTWKKAKDKDIYSCHYSSNKPLKNTSNFKLVKENISDVWCPETENGTWVMMQETEGRGIITITGNSGALVKCRKAGAANWGNSTDESVELTEAVGKEAMKRKCTVIAKRKHNKFPSAKAVEDIMACVAGKIWADEIKKLNETEELEGLKEKWSAKYKKSIDCNNPKGFSQKAHCQGRKKHD